LLLAFGVGSVIGESNYILYPIARAQLEEEVEELREEERAGAEEKELKTKQEQHQRDEVALAIGSNEFTLTLDRAHFIPLNPLSDSPGNQVKMLPNHHCGSKDTVNAAMEVYAANQILLKVLRNAI
jgi:hypothetical protein